MDRPDYEPPPWYLLRRAAKVWGVPPWELLEQNEQWLHLALEVESIEAEAAQLQRERS